MPLKDKNITIRLVLFEKTQIHPFKNAPLVQKTWTKGQHPECCNGICDIQPGVVGYDYCKNCTWFDF